MKAKIIGYWITTALLALLIGSGGVFQVLRKADAVNGVIRLGYPVYFVVLLGVWKILGAVTILVPRFPRLKEWAYAGIVFDLTGASVSHAASGSPVGNVVAPALFTLLALASWALRPESRSWRRYDTRKKWTVPGEPAAPSAPLAPLAPELPLDPALQPGSSST